MVQPWSRCSPWHLICFAITLLFAAMFLINDDKPPPETITSITRPLYEPHVMLNCAATILTLFSVLFHAGAGCCAHHDHASVLIASPPTAGSQIVERSDKQHRCSCHHHHQTTNADPDEANDAPCDDSHVGCDDHCFWLTNSRVEPPDHADATPLFIVDGCHLTAVDSTSLARILRGDPLPSVPTDCLRAELQVWRL